MLRSLQTLREGASGTGGSASLRPALGWRGEASSSRPSAAWPARQALTCSMSDTSCIRRHRAVDAPAPAMVDAGNTVIVSSTRWGGRERGMGDRFGPAGGDAGGAIVAAGNTAQVAGTKQSRTATVSASDWGRSLTSPRLGADHAHITRAARVAPALGCPERDRSASNTSWTCSGARRMELHATDRTAASCSAAAVQRRALRQRSAGPARPTGRRIRARSALTR